MSICTPDWSALASQNEKLVDGAVALDWPLGGDTGERDATARSGAAVSHIIQARGTDAGGEGIPSARAS
jgi:hypothetical protein